MKPTRGLARRSQGVGRRVLTDRRPPEPGPSAPPPSLADLQPFHVHTTSDTSAILRETHTLTNNFLFLCNKHIGWVAQVLLFSFYREIANY